MRFHWSLEQCTAIRKGFFSTGAGAELPVVWSVMLVIQALRATGLTP
jgi:hypothetical protein